MRGGGGGHTLRGTVTPLLAGLRSAACCAISSAPSKISNDIVSGRRTVLLAAKHKVLERSNFSRQLEATRKKSLRQETEDSALGCEEAGT